MGMQYFTTMARVTGEELRANGDLVKRFDGQDKFVPGWAKFVFKLFTDPNYLRRLPGV